LNSFHLRHFHLIHSPSLRLVFPSTLFPYDERLWKRNMHVM
jgi:hypothetical protein